MKAIIIAISILFSISAFAQDCVDCVNAGRSMATDNTEMLVSSTSGRELASITDQIDPLAGITGQICGSIEYLDGPATLKNIEKMETDHKVLFGEEYFSLNCGGLTILQSAILEHITGNEINVVKAVMGGLMKSVGPRAVIDALEEDVLRGANPTSKPMKSWMAELKSKTQATSASEWQALEALISAFYAKYTNPA